MLNMCYFQIKKDCIKIEWKLVYLIKFYKNYLLQVFHLSTFLLI